MPEVLWKAYIDFETGEGERQRVRNLYERLTQLTGHVKVWISFAMFEADTISLPRSQRSVEEEEDQDVDVV